MEILAIMHSLPYVLLMWGYGLVFLTPFLNLTIYIYCQYCDFSCSILLLVLPKLHHRSPRLGWIPLFHSDSPRYVVHCHLLELARPRKTLQPAPRTGGITD